MNLNANIRITENVNDIQAFERLGSLPNITITK